MSSFVIIFPLICPFGNISIVLQSAVPSNVPLTIKLCELISPCTFPLLPIVTTVVDLMLPSIVPSICTLQVVSISPCIVEHSAMIVAPSTLFGVGLVLSKIAI